MGWRGQRVSGEEEDGCCWRGVVLALPLGRGQLTVLLFKESLRRTRVGLI
jgi:hypothetical protein